MSFHSENYHDLYEKAPCGYLTLSSEGRILAVNQTFAGWIGRSPEGIVGVRLLDLLTTAGKIVFETRLSILLHLQNRFNEVALDFVSENGSLVPALVNAIRHPKAADLGTFTHLTIFNATERRRYESELLAARNELSETNGQLLAANSKLDAANVKLEAALGELSALYEALPLGIFSADETGNIIHANKNFYDILSIEPSARSLGGVKADNKNEIGDRWADAIARSEPFFARFVAGGASSGLRSIEIKSVRVVASENGTTRAVGYATDVTDQLRAEADQRQAERDSAVRQLTSGLAHHLNNLLSVTIGNLECLDEGATLSNCQRSILEDGLLGLERAASVVQRLLVYSGQGFVKPSGLCLDRMLEGTGDKLARRIGPAYTVTYRLACADLHLKIDPKMLETAFTELISNAADAMPDGGEIVCSSSLTRASTGATQAIIEVRDEGKGMDELTMARAREPFFTTHTTGQRLGLGLSFVDGIARLLGGHFSFESTFGRGTTARLSLPLITP